MEPEGTPVLLDEGLALRVPAAAVAPESRLFVLVGVACNVAAPPVVGVEVASSSDSSVLEADGDAAPFVRVAGLVAKVGKGPVRMFPTCPSIRVYDPVFRFPSPSSS